MSQDKKYKEEYDENKKKKFLACYPNMCIIGAKNINKTEVNRNEPQLKSNNKISEFTIDMKQKKKEEK